MTQPQRVVEAGVSEAAPAPAGPGEDWEKIASDCAAKTVELQAELARLKTQLASAGDTLNALAARIAQGREAVVGAKAKTASSLQDVAALHAAQALDEAARRRLSSLLALGSAPVGGSSRAAAHALSILSVHHQRRFKRDLLKPLDLTHFIAPSGEIVAEVLEELRSVSSATDSQCFDCVVAALETLHERCVPKLGYGCEHGEKHMPGAHAVRVAWDHGARLFDMADWLDMSPTPGDVCPDKWGDDLRGCDLSDAVISSCPNPFVREDDGRSMRSLVRDSFHGMIEALGPLDVGEGQPVLDNYKLVCPYPLFKLPHMSPHGCLSEVWEAMEELVDEGKVRTLGVSNFTIKQVETLLQHCRIRPVLVAQERHILNQIPEYRQFCKDHKLAMMAVVPLAVGQVLTSKTLDHPHMSAAQAALHWNMTQCVSVVPGAETLDQVKENCATLSKMSLAPVDAPEPPVKLTDVYNMLATMCGAGGDERWKSIYHLGNPADCGIFEIKEGKLHNAVHAGRLLQSRTAGPETTMEDLGDQQQLVLGDVHAVIRDLETAMSVHARRIGIDAYIKGMQQADGPEAEEPSPRDSNANKQHELRAPQQGSNLTRMRVLPLTALLEYGAIPRRGAAVPEVEYKVPNVGVDSLQPEDRVLFFSHRWLTPSPMEVASPDDAHGTKFRQIVASVESWCAKEGVAEQHAYVWVDFCCIDQDDFEELLRGVNSLGLYVCSCDAFITIEHEVYYERGWCLMECMFADAGYVPRFEYLEAGRTALRASRLEAELVRVDADTKLLQKKPHEGTFTVETDRRVMKLLELLASTIQLQLRQGIPECIPNQLKSSRSRKRMARSKSRFLIIAPP